MKIAIAATGKDLESDINPRFGRAPFFLIVDSKTKEKKTVVNTIDNRSSGVGITAGNLVLEEGIDVVITTNIGPETFKLFEEGGITIYQAKGKIKDAVQQLVRGKLPRIKKATAPKYIGIKSKKNN
jgi:predicted Fe-Mo cluster-binding NifX family protein